MEGIQNMNVIIITGASSGMGAEFAFQLDYSVGNIDEIWLIARRREAMLEVAQNMEHTTRVLDMDITNAAHIARFKNVLEKDKPVIRMLVNCAGYGVMGQFTKLDMNEQLGMIDVNCRALTQLTYMCIPYMRKNSRIIQLASSAAFMPQPGFAVYAASKAYVFSFSRALGRELKARKIYVTAVCPGPVNTPFFDTAEKNGKILAVKKLAMAQADKVVEKAISDSFRKREKSVYGGWINAFGIAAKLIPHRIILAFLPNK